MKCFRIARTSRRQIKNIFYHFNHCMIQNWRFKVYKIEMLSNFILGGIKSWINNLFWESVKFKEIANVKKKSELQSKVLRSFELLWTYVLWCYWLCKRNFNEKADIVYQWLLLSGTTHHHHHNALNNLHVFSNKFYTLR